MAKVYRLQLDKHTIGQLKSEGAIIDMVIKFDTEDEIHEMMRDLEVFFKKIGAYIEGMNFEGIKTPPPGGIKPNVNVIHEDTCQLGWDI